MVRIYVSSGSHALTCGCDEQLVLLGLGKLDGWRRALNDGVVVLVCSDAGCISNFVHLSLTSCERAKLGITGEQFRLLIVLVRSLAHGFLKMALLLASRYAVLRLLVQNHFVIWSVRARSLSHFHLLHIDIKKHLIGRLSNSCTRLLILNNRVIWRIAYIIYVWIVDWTAPDWILVLPINNLTASYDLLLYVMKTK